MSRLTARIGDKVYYAKGKHSPTTLCAEMETWEVRECMVKLAAYEDAELMVVNDMDKYKATIKETFLNDGFIFIKENKYIVDQDKDYIILTDNHGKDHYLTYEDASRFIKTK